MEQSFQDCAPGSLSISTLMRTRQATRWNADSAGNPVVSEFAFSAIWRNAPMNDAEDRPAELFDFVRKADPELLPYHPGRTKITPAERLFGFVAQEESRNNLYLFGSGAAA